MHKCVRVTNETNLSHHTVNKTFMYFMCRFWYAGQLLSTITLLLMHAILKVDMAMTTDDQVIFDNVDIHQSHYILGIVNGSNTEDGEWPFVVAILYGSNLNLLCGGSVWNNHWIVTAAHCMFYKNDTRIPASKFNIYMGHTRIDNVDQNYLFKAKSLTPHESYDRVSKHNDIALVELEGEIDFVNGQTGVSCVCQPKALKLVSTSQCYVIGWGDTKNSRLTYSNTQKEVNVPILSNQYCSQQDSSYDPALQICAGYDEGGKDSCQGDSGGPLMCPVTTDPNIYALTGVVSFGRGCAKAQAPGYYTKVSSFLGWLKSKTGC